MHNNNNMNNITDNNIFTYIKDFSDNSFKGPFSIDIFDHKKTQLKSVRVPEYQTAETIKFLNNII